MPIVPFGEWLPDQPALTNPGATVIKNVFPRTAKSYGPIGSLSVYSSALTARCQGLFTTLGPDGTTNVFAGDATKLYRLAAGVTWEDVSNGTYSTATDGRWSFASFGSRVIATNYAEAIQSYVIGTSTDFANLSAGAPKARYCAVIRDFLMVGNTYDASDGDVPSRVWWSAFGDPTSWPTVGSSAAAQAQSDLQDLPEGGWVQGIVGGLRTADGAVFLERKIYRISYVGPDAVFQFDDVESARGTHAPGSIAQVGGIVYYLGEDGFYAFDGTESRPIGFGKVDKTFFGEVDQSNYYRISSAVDPLNKLIFWSFISTSGSGTNPDKTYIYNYALDRWSCAEFDHEIIGRSQSLGTDLDSLDGLGYTDLDALPFSLDSRAWTAGRVLLTAFNTSHRMSYFTGDNLAATLETAEFTGEAGRRIYVGGFRPIVDGGTPTGIVRYRNTQSASLTDSSSASAGDDGVIPFRIDARYARAQVTVPAASSWSHAQGIEPRFKESGRR